MLDKKIAVLPGDGIGPEVVEASLLVLDKVLSKFSHSFSFEKGLIGGSAYELLGSHFPEETLQLVKSSDAILFGSVGGPVSEQHLPKWKGCEANSLLKLRKNFNFYCNLRPIKVYPSLSVLSPLIPEIVADGVDFLIVRELLGDVYFGEHKRFQRANLRVATDVCQYDELQIRKVVVKAFEISRSRKRNLISVDKANVLETSRLWREIVEEVAEDFKDVEFKHMLVDNCAMQIIQRPSQFDVIVTSNMFGDILSDAASVIPGSLGLIPSASLNQEGLGYYEPSGGSAQDIANKGIANPIAQILSAAMMLRLSFGLEQEATLIENAVEFVLNEGILTGDLIRTKLIKPVGTLEIANEIANRI